MPSLLVSPEEASAELLRRQEVWHKIQTYYPETGPLRRELYVKHQAFFAAGADHNDRLAICGNRTGKTEGIGAYEVTLHLTGEYPDWWVGRRFDEPVDWWVAGKTAETTRDILQARLLGKFTRRLGDDPTETIGLGTGMIPRDRILGTSPKSGVSDAVDMAWIEHVSGGRSQLGFKSYGRDRDSFEGVNKHGVWLDEEPPKDVYDECQIRLMATRPGQRNGLMLVTFTPLAGYTEVVKAFLEADDPDKFHIQIGWKDAPHLTPAIVAEMSKKFASQPHILRARSEGEPAMGEGAIYPVDIETLAGVLNVSVPTDPPATSPASASADRPALFTDFVIPSHWARGYGMDVGKTAVIWGALDKQADCLYLYREYFSEEYNPLLHATAIKGTNDRDAWIPGMIDPGSLGSSQVDGKKLFTIYTSQYKLNLSIADNAVEAGIGEVLNRMQTGRLKVFRSLSRWQKEFARYHRMNMETVFGIQSKIVKKDDHELDATRYLAMHTDRMRTAPANRTAPTRVPSGDRSWMT